MSESSIKPAVITAIITCIATIAAGVATYWLTTKEPELAYTVSGGPSLEGASSSKRIFLIDVQNSGKKEIAQTYVRIGMPGADLAEVQVEASPGVKLKKESEQGFTALYADSLNPGERVKVSFLASMGSVRGDPQIIVRAPGVTATNLSADSSSSLLFKNNSIDYVFFAMGFAALLSSFLIRYRNSRHLGGTSGVSLESNELCAFICDSSGLSREARAVRFSGAELSYRGFADYLASECLKVPEEDQYKYLHALKAMLYVSPLAGASRNSIENWIRHISKGAVTDDEFIQIKKDSFAEGENPTAWREKIAKTCQKS